MDSPLACFTGATCRQLALLLDAKKLLLSDHGYQRDWRGVMQLLGGDYSWQLQLQQLSSPTEALVQRCRLLPVHRLRQALESTGRYDVWDNVHHLIVRDTEQYVAKLRRSGFEEDLSSPHPQLPLCSQQQLLCVGDAECIRRGAALRHFDAFLLYDDSDSQFASEIIDHMESLGVQLCDRERHLLPGVAFEHVSAMKLIRERCSRVLALISPAFLQSPVNAYLAMFAQADSLDSGRCSLVPCVVRSCTLPAHLLYCSRLDFTRSAARTALWRRMFDSLTCHRSPPERDTGPAISTTTGESEGVSSAVHSASAGASLHCRQQSPPPSSCCEGPLTARTGPASADCKSSRLPPPFPSAPSAPSVPSLLRRVHDRVFSGWQSLRPPARESVSRVPPTLSLTTHPSSSALSSHSPLPSSSTVLSSSVSADFSSDCVSSSVSPPTHTRLSATKLTSPLSPPLSSPLSSPLTSLLKAARKRTKRNKKRHSLCSAQQS